MTEQQSDVGVAPLTKTVTVPLHPEAAFRRFTEEIATWWPMQTHSVGGEKTESVVFDGRVGGRVYERQQDGSTSVWGTVTAWELPVRVAFTWHPGREADSAQHVDVRFTPDGTGTNVTLVHSNWERLGEGAEGMRKQYETGWDHVLGRFAG